MPKLTFEPTPDARQTVDVAGGETVLTALLRAGHAVPNSCRAGACQACLMQATAGPVPAKAQVGLKETLKASGYFLSCCCEPAGEMVVRLPGAEVAGVRGRVAAVERLSRDVGRIRIEPKEPFVYRAGQFVNLVRGDGLIRSYSLASLHPADGGCPGDPHLELHVRRVAGGAMSSRLVDEAGAGDEIELRGPAGECFYVPGQPERSLLLVGTGTGLAPLYGIARDALRHGHTGPIRLYHGARSTEGLYLVDELRELTERHPNVTYHACVLAGEEREGVRVGDLGATVIKDLPMMAGWRVFLRGDPGIVTALRKKFFLAGAKMSDISADAFLTRVV